MSESVQNTNIAVDVAPKRGRAPKFVEQRETILRGAAALFASQGFHHASMAALAKVTGLSKPLIYHYYKDKEEILFDIVDSYMTTLVQIVHLNKARAEAEKWVPVRHITCLIEEFTTQYQWAKNQHMVLVQDVKFLNDEMRAQVLEKEREVVQAFADQVVRIYPQLSTTKLTKPLTMMLFGMMNWTFTWHKDNGELSYKALGPLMTTLFLSGIEGIVLELQVNSAVSEKLKIEG